MSLTVREALSLNVLKGARVVAGHKGLDNPIRWTHILDHPDVATWVKGGEILLTSGLGIYDDPQAQTKYMREAAEKKIAAVFVAVQEYMPQTTRQMRALADQYNLPLVELPQTTPFVEVTEAILRRLAARSPDAEREYLLDALLAGNLPESEEAMKRLAETGIEPDQPAVVAVAQFAGAATDTGLSDEERQTLIAPLNQAPRRAVLINRPDRVVAIYPSPAREQSSVPFARSLEELPRPSSKRPVRVGIGRLARKLADFPISYREAEEALFIAGLTDGGKVVRHYNDLGVWRLILRIKDETELQRFADYYLNPVVAHDLDQQTGWLRTLETYLDHNGNLRATARALKLHRNTITYQLEHISRLLEKDLGDPEVRLSIQVALKVRKLLTARGR
jgi:DNA-binding PucR family transcriptional regulator